MREIAPSGEPMKFTEVQLSTKDAAFLEGKGAQAPTGFVHVTSVDTAGNRTTSTHPWPPSQDEVDISDHIAQERSRGLTTIATDGERNGRLSWVPGAR